MECGKKLTEQARFCPHCGCSTATAATRWFDRRRPATDEPAATASLAVRPLPSSDDRSDSARASRRSTLLSEIEAATPWADLRIATAGLSAEVGRGRVTAGSMDQMLRGYVAQLCLGLSDEGLADALLDSRSVAAFVGTAADMHSPTLDASTMSRFRRLLEQGGHDAKIAASIKERLASRGLTLRAGSISEAAITPIHVMVGVVEQEPS